MRKSAAASRSAAPRVVVDTNVLISAFAFGGTPAEAIRRAAPNVWVSPPLLQEYREVPQELWASGKITRAQLQALLAGIASFVAYARMVRPHKRLAICRDPEDNRVLECCRAARARFLITGDRDLLELDPPSASRGELEEAAHSQSAGFY
ncbi:MAG: putative toxin-antitoxin system toxin component, PIN family [Candidatus Bipolaricaulota bacterium]|nr:putative toxin-antitoxin system toxin component, PIN family [Candidatus Bipolaricaulota bacterium]